MKCAGIWVTLNYAARFLKKNTSRRPTQKRRRFGGCSLSLSLSPSARRLQSKCLHQPNDGRPWTCGLFAYCGRLFLIRPRGGKRQRFFLLLLLLLSALSSTNRQRLVPTPTLGNHPNCQRSLCVCVCVLFFFSFHRTLEPYTRQFHVPRQIETGRNKRVVRLFSRCAAAKNNNFIATGRFFFRILSSFDYCFFPVIFKYWLLFIPKNLIV